MDTAVVCLGAWCDIETPSEELRGLRYDVEFSDRLRARVSAGT